MSRRCVVALGGLLLGLAQSGGAAEGTWPESKFNPQPAKDDVVLPLPCNGAMAFRRVAIPATGPLDDKRIVIGGNDERFAYSEGLRAAYLAGAFRSSERNGEHFYLLGKYEVTNAQYRAIGGECAAKGDDDVLPASKIGWFDAVLFTERMTEWLVTNKATSLPAQSGMLGAVRLPTEEEWEFAARGGTSVSESEFAKTHFPTPGGLEGYVWFQGQRSANGEKQPVGLLKPNPLGLYDILGNVDELMLEPFRLNKVGRLHGQAGGALVKGGNYMTSERDVRAAYRQEVPLFDSAGQKRAKTTGFRVVVAVPVIGSRQDIKDIQAAWDALPKVSLSGDKTRTTDGVDPLVALEDLKEQNKENSALATRIDRAAASVRAQAAGQNEQLARAARSMIRLGAFLQRKLTDDAQRLKVLTTLMQARVSAGADEATVSKLKRNLAENSKTLNENIEYFADTVVQVAQEYQPLVIKQQFGVLSDEFKNRKLDGLIPSAGKFVACVEKYSSHAVKSPAECISEATVIKETRND